MCKPPGGWHVYGCGVEKPPGGWEVGRWGGRRVGEAVAKLGMADDTCVCNW